MAASAEFQQYVLEQLSAIPNVTARRMFGGVALYGAGVFFGLIFGDTLYFKVGDANRADYTARGMRPFQPNPAKSRGSANYFEVPADVLEDREACAAWAARAVALAGAAQSPAAARSTKNRRRSSRPPIPQNRSE